jgi:hypothetical protein
MDDPEDKDDAVLVDDVVHHPIVADPKTVERVGCAPDGLDALARDAAGFACMLGK